MRLHLNMWQKIFPVPPPHEFKWDSHNKTLFLMTPSKIRLRGSSKSSGATFWQIDLFDYIHNKALSLSPGDRFITICRVTLETFFFQNFQELNINYVHQWHTVIKCNNIMTMLRTTCNYKIHILREFSETHS